MTDFNGALDLHFARMLYEQERREEEQGAIDDMADYIAKHGDELEEATYELDDMTSELFEALAEQKKASEAKDPNAITEAAYGVVEVMDKIAAAYAPKRKQAEDAA
ncbi:MAG TPA: hypothetical protein ENO14_00145 [Chromatiales bacterium]|nr:hypothetical protein [Chromatiales bacterium]